MVKFYDRDGQEISLEQFGQLFDDTNYRVVRHNVINGKIVSTIWLGLDYNHGLSNRILIFETMVIDGDNYEICRTSTVEDAIDIHEKIEKSLLRG